MPQESYRYYRLDETGLHDAEEFVAENDEQAVAQVVAKYPAAKWELFLGHRLVAKSDAYMTRRFLDATLPRLPGAHRTLRDTAALVAQPPSRPDGGGDAR